MMPDPSTLTVTEIVNQQLDKAYNQTAGTLLSQITLMTTTAGSLMQSALSDLQDEVDHLDQLGNPLERNNPYLVKVLAIFRQVMETVASLMSNSARIIEDTGVMAGVGSITARVFGSLGKNLYSMMANPVAMVQSARTTGIEWNIPEEFERISSSDQWIEKMDRFAVGYFEYLSALLDNKLSDGVSSTEVISWLSGAVAGIPYYSAENLTRTIQLTAYRNSMVAVEKVNTHVIAYKIRIAQLDTRTCLSCISLHGTILSVGAAIEDHYRGRCSCYYVVIGGKEQPDFMKVEISPGVYEFVPYQDGESWFASLPEDRQQIQASFASSPGKYNAYRSGNPLSAFVLHRHDDAFGDMVFENSISGAFGRDADLYYAQGE